MAAASLVPSPVQPFAAAFAAGETIVGTGMEKIGEATGNEEMREGGKVNKQIGEVGGLPSVAKGGGEVLKKAATGGN